MYAVIKEITKFPEHYEVAQPKYAVIDLEQQKIVKTVDIPKEELGNNQGDIRSGAIDVSPDGKYLYQLARRSPFCRPPTSKRSITSTWPIPAHRVWRISTLAPTWI
jgi:hypothetical protein